MSTTSPNPGASAAAAGLASVAAAAQRMLRRPRTELTVLRKCWLANAPEVATARTEEDAVNVGEAAVATAAFDECPRRRSATRAARWQLIPYHKSHTHVLSYTAPHRLVSRVIQKGCANKTEVTGGCGSVGLGGVSTKGRTALDIAVGGIAVEERKSGSWRRVARPVLVPLASAPSIIRSVATCFPRADRARACRGADASPGDQRSHHSCVHKPTRNSAAGMAHRRPAAAELHDFAPTARMEGQGLGHATAVDVSTDTNNNNQIHEEQTMAMGMLAFGAAWGCAVGTHSRHIHDFTISGPSVISMAAGEAAGLATAVDINADTNNNEQRPPTLTTFVPLHVSHEPGVVAGASATGMTHRRPTAATLSAAADATGHATAVFMHETSNDQTEAHGTRNKQNKFGTSSVETAGATTATATAPVTTVVSAVSAAAAAAPPGMPGSTNRHRRGAAGSTSWRLPQPSLSTLLLLLLVVGVMQYHRHMHSGWGQTPDGHCPPRHPPH